MRLSLLSLSLLLFFCADLLFAVEVLHTELPKTRDTLNDFVLRGGAGASISGFMAYNLPVRAKIFHGGGSFASQFGYKFERLEWSISSYCTISEIQDIRLVVGNSEIESDEGKLTSVTFGPKLRYYFPWELLKHWSGYVTAGGLAGLMTLKFEKARVSGSTFQPHQKLAYQGEGAVFGLGVELRAKKSANGSSGEGISGMIMGLWEELPYYVPEMYLEAVYKYMKGSKVSVIGGTKKEVKTLRTEDRHQWVEEHTIMFILGMKIF
ncbi:MAG: hypothetical protein HQK50_04805 [Oligoflexia bacterium]|nr:hypothetical protein [Oligoflexia bacterium]MBF0364866.1 hypothetical protein [Oligoflexia bacterium]